MNEPTTADYLNQLEDDREELIINLDTMGVAVTGEETFTELAQLVLDIPTGGGGVDFTTLGFPSTPEAISNGYNYALNIKNTWVESSSLRGKYKSNTNIVFFPQVSTTSTTLFREMFQDCTNLLSVAPIDTSNGEIFLKMFLGCTNLKDIPAFNLSKATSLTGMFTDCANLSDTSLYNILQSCISTTSAYTGTKTLVFLGMSSSYKTRVESLSNYQNFLNAGWTTGFN